MKSEYYTKNGFLGEIKTMETKKVFVEGYFKNAYEQKIIQMCFDAKSIGKFTPGLKMVYALDDPPLFVKLKKIEDVATVTSSY